MNTMTLQEWIDSAIEPSLPQLVEQAWRAWNALTYRGTESQIGEQERDWEYARLRLREHLQSLGLDDTQINRLGGMI